MRLFTKPAFLALAFLFLTLPGRAEDKTLSPSAQKPAAAPAQSVQQAAARQAAVEGAVAQQQAIQNLQAANPAPEVVPLAGVPGQREKVVNYPDGRTVTTVYDADDRIVHVETKKNGKIVSWKDVQGWNPDGSVRDYTLSEFDTDGRLVSLETWNAGNLLMSTKNTYHSNGKMATQVMTMPGNSSFHYKFDTQERLIQKTTYLAGSPIPASDVTYEYVEPYVIETTTYPGVTDGLRSVKRTYLKVGASQVIQKTEESYFLGGKLNGRTVTDYDSTGRPVKVTHYDDKGNIITSGAPPVPPANPLR